MVPTDVREDAVTPLERVDPVKVPAGAITAFPDAAVTRPLPFTVNDGIEVEDPKLPTLELTVASVVAVDPALVVAFLFVNNRLQLTVFVPRC